MVLERPLCDKELDALRGMDTCSVSNAIETFEVRLRNTGFVKAQIRCIFEDFPPMVGYAATARLRTDDPPIAGPFITTAPSGGTVFFRCPHRVSRLWKTWTNHRASELSWGICTPSS